MYSSPAEILAALDEYRSHIAAKNRRALEVYVPFITNAEEPEEGDFYDGFDAGKQRMEVLKQLIGDNNILEDKGISVPARLLERYDELSPLLGLDGTFKLVVDAQGRARKRDEYFSAVEENLKQKCIEEVRDVISIPEELRSLAEHVDGLHGPGLDYYRGASQLAAWWGLKEDRETYRARVKMPDEMTDWLSLTGWTIGGGWDLGKGPDASLFAVYCRRPEDNAWGWRYVLASEYGEDVFETIPELLAWHSHFREQDLSEMPEFDEEDMWVLMF